MIGVTPGIAGPSESRSFARLSDVLYCGADYVRNVAGAGGVPILLTITDDADSIAKIVSLIDGLLLTGGEDVHPSHYGQSPLMPEQVAMRERDHFEFKLLELFLPTGKPVLAICRGHQVLNVALGGTLIQDIPSLVGTAHHSQTALPPSTTHHVELTANCALTRIFGTQKVDVNSYHHQAVDKVAPALQVIGRSEEGIVEAVEQTDHPFLIGVQWHPERITDNSNVHRRLFESFVVACKEGSHERG